eukprot:TRINITY_DN18915_c0_g1_i1.p2 TRINITY_DN18915_c0_g1~~TRINITY_DN18915_c0_g1_i1.p2  ORF type:complete len:301 (+),score=38.22 TRINITY_DN18915_c0_g1_i1:78-980(+)
MGRLDPLHKPAPPLKACFDQGRFDTSAPLLSWLLLLLYLPIGSFVAVLRTLVGPVWAVVYHLLLPDAIRPWVVRCIAGPFFGYSVTWDNIEYLHDAKKPFVIVCNHVSDMEQNMFRAISNCTVLTRVTLPFPWVYDMMEFVHVGQRGERDRSMVKERIRKEISAGDKPVFVFAEGGTTNGKAGLLQYQKFVFSLPDVTIVPVAMSVSNLLPIRLDHLGVHPSFFGVVGNMVWMAFIPWKRYHFKFLPPQHARRGESDIDYAKRVQRLTAHALDIAATDYTYKDKAAFRQELYSERGHKQR